MKASIWIERVFMIGLSLGLIAFYLSVLNSARPPELQKNVSDRYWKYFIERSSGRY